MPEPPSYAPTATTNYTIPSYHEEVTRSHLIHTPKHKDLYNSLAEIYSILSVLETVESSYIKDYITNKEKYTSTTLRLINQYQILVNGIKDDPSQWLLVQDLLKITDMKQFIDSFCSHFNIVCPLAAKRLNSGVPVTIEQFEDPSSSSLSRNTTGRSTPVGEVVRGGRNVKFIAEVTSNFITCMDALKLNYNSKDQLHPLLSDLVINLNELIETDKSFEFQGKSKLITWLIKLNNLTGELSDGEIEEFLNDLNEAYRNFYSTLE